MMQVMKLCTANTCTTRYAKTLDIGNTIGDLRPGSEWRLPSKLLERPSQVHNSCCFKNKKQSKAAVCAWHVVQSCSWSKHTSASRFGCARVHMQVKHVFEPLLHAPVHTQL